MRSRHLSAVALEWWRNSGVSSVKTLERLASLVAFVAEGQYGPAGSWSAEIRAEVERAQLEARARVRSWEVTQ